jgi:nucleoside-diphosphate-sugar epimerase
VRLKLDDKSILILGTNGNIARAVAERFPHATKVPRQDYLNWLVNGESEIDEFLSKNKIIPEIIFNCVGVTNPSADNNLLMNLNFELPKLLIKKFAQDSVKVVTFGTVMENNKEYALSNNYLKSKFLLHNWLSELSSSESFVHIQLHTLFGGRNIHEYMFLGQIHNAIKSQIKFSMTSGLQLREYHHVDDDVSAAVELINRNFLGIHSISHGNPIRLRDVAEEIFRHFNSLDLLEVGKITANEFDSLRPILPKNTEIVATKFRDTKIGIIRWLDANL